ncbi:MAG: homoserine dehydrogenase [Dehalococcoidia bacterium]|nr:homoserine dehydrogenase [Dehalococcoidia bacterium]
MAVDRAIGVGLLGLGVVGTGVAQTLLRKPSVLAERIGAPLVIRGALVRDPAKARALSPLPFPLTSDPARLLEASDVDIVVEVMGGEHPALEYLEHALRAGKHVVTANKEVMAKHGHRLRALAQQLGVQIRFEASVGGGIPIIGPLQRDLLANDITSLRAIINGTTNYILTRMANEGLDFAVALRHAQELGYAEPDPTNDVEGIDAAYKLAILASLAFHTPVTPADVPHEGVTRLRTKDFQYAKELGYAIKLLAISVKDDAGLSARVHPALVPQETLLAKVDGAYNAVEIKGDLTGTVTFHGLGAGAQPTASAILGDVVNVARALCGHAQPAAPPLSTPSKPAVRLRGLADLVTRYYLRMSVGDQAGVLAQIANVLGQQQISLASVIQKDADPAAKTAEIVITTHPAQEARMQRALEMLSKLPVVKEINNVIRVEPV